MKKTSIALLGFITLGAGIAVHQLHKKVEMPVSFSTSESKSLKDYDPDSVLEKTEELQKKVEKTLAGGQKAEDLPEDFKEKLAAADKELEKITSLSARLNESQTEFDSVSEDMDNLKESRSKLEEKLSKRSKLSDEEADELSLIKKKENELAEKRLAIVARMEQQIEEIATHK